MKVFWSFTRQSFHNSVIYRFEFWVRIFQIFLTMYSMHWLWSILYSHKALAFGVDMKQMITYGILGAALQTVMSGGMGFYIAGQIRTGMIDTELMKPIDFHIHMLARSFGQTIFSFTTLFLPAIIIAYFFLEFQLPSSGMNGIYFIFSIFLAYFVLFSIDFLIGMLSMVTMSIDNIGWAYGIFVSFFAGQMVPLWLFPSFLKSLADLLPFRCIYDIPMSIYIGKLSGQDALQGILFQLIWVAFLFCLGRWIWGRVHTRLVVQGG